jgi:hypothetical protein
VRRLMDGNSSEQATEHGRRVAHLVGADNAR